MSLAIVRSRTRVRSALGCCRRLRLRTQSVRTRNSGLLRCALGVGVEYESEYEGSDKFGFELQIFGEALHERFSNDIQASPIARSSDEAEVGIGILYRF